MVDSVYVFESTDSIVQSKLDVQIFAATFSLHDLKRMARFCAGCESYIYIYIYTEAPRVLVVS